MNPPSSRVMATFRQLFVMAIISFGAAAGAVSQLPYGDVWGALGLLWTVATSGAILPITAGLTLIVALLLWWNPEQ